MATDPPPLERRNWLMYLHYTRGDFAQCRNILSQELERSNGRSEYAHYMNGMMLVDEEKIQEALEVFQKCYKINPANVDNIKAVAQCFFRLRRYRLALTAYLEAENSADTADWDVYHHLGECLLRLGDTTKAIEYVRRAAQIAPQEKSVTLLNKLLTANRDFAGAISVCSNALLSFPESVDLLIELGILYLRTGEAQFAFERLGSALALSPNNFRALLAVGCITQNHGDFDVALAKYRLAAQQVPLSPALWSNIALCFYVKQKYVGAISCLQRALWQAPLNWRVLYNLGLVHLSTQQPASAFHFLCASVNLQPDYASSFMLLGVALHNLHDVENSMRAFRQSFEMNPEDPVIVLNYAICLWSRGNVDQASNLMTKFQSFLNSSEHDIDEVAIKTAEQLIALLPPAEAVESEADKTQERLRAAFAPSAPELEPDEV